MTTGVSVAGRPIREEFLIVDGGKLAGTGAASYSVSGTTGPGSSGQNSKDAAAIVADLPALRTAQAALRQAGT